MNRSVRPAMLVVAALFLFSAGQAAAQQAGPASNGGGAPVDLEAYQLDGNLDINLDGRIDEQAWDLATPITDFTQQEPVEGGVPSEPTEIRVVFDNDNLYIGAIFYDDPDGVIAFQKERDAFLSSDDRFMWILDTFRDGRTGYFFEINPAGMMGDAILSGGGGRGGGRGGFGGGGGGGGGRAWDGIWEARTQMRPDGWSAEVRIPFRTLNFDPEQTDWGINFQRTIRRKNEEILWRGWRRREGLRSPIYAGVLTGLQNMSQGIGLEAVPSTIGSWQNFLSNSDPTVLPRTTDTNWPGDVSLDINYSVTSSLRASFSVNTDFAEVESDQRRVNLTRFPLRFPEQRDFFLEGSGVFSFAPSSGPSPFYSRHIGLNAGQPIPIQYGARMTGQVGSYEVGFYQINTSDHTFFSQFSGSNVTIPTENFTVGRIKKQIFEQSSIGMIYTRRGTDGAADVGQTVGADLSFNTRNLFGRYNMNAEAFVVWNSNPDAVANPNLTFGDLSSRGLRVSFPNDVWSGHVSYREFGDWYDPSLGFVFRNNFRRVEPRIGWSPRVESVSWIRNLNFHTQWRTQWQLGTGTVEEEELQIKVLGINFESGDGIDFDLTRAGEYLDRDFDISPGVTITGMRDYDWWDSRIFLRTTSRRMVSIFGGYTFGDFWDGERKSIFGRTTLRPNPGVSLSFNVQYNDVTMPTGAFTASLYELEGQWNPTPWVAFTNQLQYDDQSGLFGLFARMRWILTPGSDLYLVYTHNWQNLGTGLFDNRDLVMLSRGGSIKANYTYRF